MPPGQASHLSPAVDPPMIFKRTEHATAMAETPENSEEVVEKPEGPPRYPTSVPAQILALDEVLQGTLSALSAADCEVTDVSSALPEGNDLRLRFSFFKTSTPVKLRANLSETIDKGYVFRFLDLDHFMKNVLRMAVMQLRKHSKGRASSSAHSLLGG